MANGAALEFEDLFSVEPTEDEPTCYFDKFFADAELASLGINVAKLERETQSIDERATGIYRKIAATAAPKTKTAASLAKNAPTTSKKVREEITRYPSGAEVVAEIGERGEVLRTYSRDGAA